MYNYSSYQKFPFNKPLHALYSKHMHVCIIASLSIYVMRNICTYITRFILYLATNDLIMYGILKEPQMSINGSILSIIWM